MRIATWNVNSVNARLETVLAWFREASPDVACLQEIKCVDEKFPTEAFESLGYNVATNGQKTYNGVALLAKSPLTEVIAGNPHYPDPQKRLLAATIDGIRVICAYIPNGQEVGSDKYAYKLEWLAALEKWLAEELAAHPQLVLAGDFNIVPDDRDVYDPVAWAGKVLCSEPERASFRRMLELGLVDSFRLFEQPEKTFSWWDYRMLGFQKNLGMRIDHLLLSAPLAARCTASTIDRAPRKRERPSDHAPAVVELA